VEAIYNQERERLKVILTGSIATVVSFLRFLTVYLDE